MPAKKKVKAKTASPATKNGTSKANGAAPSAAAKSANKKSTPLKGQVSKTKSGDNHVKSASLSPRRKKVMKNNFY